MIEGNRSYSESKIPIIDAPQDSFSKCENCAFNVAEGQNKTESRVVCSRIQKSVKENQTCSKWKSVDILLCNQDYFNDLINEIKAGFHHNEQLKRFYNDLSTKISEFEKGNLLSDFEEVDGQLLDLDKEEFDLKYSELTKQMETSRSWYFLEGLYKGTRHPDYTNANFKKIKTPKYLALGRSSFYDKFMDDLEDRYNEKYYQSDYMIWLDPGDPYKSLLFYIETAEKIHFSLEGISEDDLLFCVGRGERVPDRKTLGKPYMTLWEINQIIFSDYKHKTTWYIRGGIDREQVKKIMCPLIHPNKIIFDY